MKLGDVVIDEFPFTNLAQTKIRPAIVVATTDDFYNDVILCLISSVVPPKLSPREVALNPSTENGLRVPSIIKAYRIATIHQSKILSKIGTLSNDKLRNLLLHSGY
ncbi:MAG: type II toxin-antitoxin system PemK/MazF family toxin [Bacteroidota bacterium]|nr:type II toxin-antitoxin system PemK/MazF family toxin [Bacteroidota bacterium]